MADIGSSKTRYEVACIHLRSASLGAISGNLDQMVQLAGTGIQGYAGIADFWRSFLRRTMSEDHFCSILAGALVASGQFVFQGILPTAFLNQAMRDAYRDGEQFLWPSGLSSDGNRVRVEPAVRWLLDHEDYSDRVPNSLRLVMTSAAADRDFPHIINHEVLPTEALLPVKQKAGRKPAYDWEALEMAYSKRVEEIGAPCPTNNQWRSQADVLSWIWGHPEFEGAGESTCKPYVRRWMGLYTSK